VQESGAFEPHHAAHQPIKGNQTMNTTEAMILADRFIKDLEGAGVEPARNEYGLMVQAYNELLEGEETADLGHTLHAIFPNIIDQHDERGNNVANENDWTPIVEL
jgi:hypothetical protein